MAKASDSPQAAGTLDVLLAKKNAAIMKTCVKPQGDEGKAAWERDVEEAIRLELLLSEFHLSAGEYMQVFTNLLSATSLAASLKDMVLDVQVHDTGEPCQWLAKMRHHTDPPSTEEIAVRCELEPGSLGIGIHVDGYGVKTMEPGHGAVAYLEFYEGKLRLHVWEDINEEDPTHSVEMGPAPKKVLIDMESAREANRRD